MRLGRMPSSHVCSNMQGWTAPLYQRQDGLSLSLKHSRFVNMVSATSLELSTLPFRLECAFVFYLIHKGIYYQSHPYTTRRPGSGHSLLCSMRISQNFHEHEQQSLCSRKVHSSCGATLPWYSRRCSISPTCYQMSQQIRSWVIWNHYTSSPPVQRRGIATITNPTSRPRSVKE